MKWALWLVVVLVVAGCAQAPSSGSGGSEAGFPADPGSEPLASIPALFGHSSAAATGGSEPSILADKEGRFVWIGDTGGTSWSDDNGTSWHHMAYTGNLGVAFGDGVALGQDDRGRLYAAYLHDNRIDVARSDDGKTFAQATLAAGAFAGVDRPWIGAHGDGEVALFYIDAVGVVYFPAFAGHCARSTDAGLTFTDQNVASTTPQGGKAFYDTAGRFYYSQSNGAVSRFDSTCRAGGREMTLLGSLGLNNMIQADADGTDVYMAAATAGVSEITLAGRRDDGTTRSLVVSPPELQANTYATVSAWRGDAAVAWYGSTSPGDPSADGFTGDFNVYLSVVHDFWGAATVTTSQLTAAPNHHGTICMGGVGCTGNRELLDYFMIDHDRWGGLHVAYVDDAHGGGTFYAHVPPELLQGGPAAGGAPHAAFVATVQGDTVTVDARGSTAAPDTSLQGFAWDWGDGGHGAGETAQHRYAKFGAFTVTLNVTDAAGRTGTASRSLIVESSSPSSTRTSTSGHPSQPAASSKVPVKGSASSSQAGDPTSSAKGTPGVAWPATGLALLGVASLAQGISRGRLSRRP